MTEFSTGSFKSYVVTGITNHTGHRFSIKTDNAMHAMGINLWRGNVWGVLPNGKKKLIKRVWN